MENPVIAELYSLVDKIRETDELIESVENPDSKICIVMPNSMIKLNDVTDQGLKSIIITLFRKDQADGWNKILELMNANSPFQ